MPRGEYIARAWRDADLPIRIRDLSVKVGPTVALRDISVTLAGRGVTMVIGPNGAGKSTLLRTLHGLVRASSGVVAWGEEGRACDRVRQAMVFQRPVLLRRSARANLTYALKLTGVKRSERTAEAVRLLRLAGLEAVADKPARRLSWGEQQRLAMARAIGLAPEVLLLDEPTASLDPGATGQVEGLIRQASENGARIVMSTHDIGQARRLADEVAFLHGGRLVECGSAAQLLRAPASPSLRAFLDGQLLY